MKNILIKRKGSTANEGSLMFSFSIPFFLLLSDHITSWEIDGETVETVSDFLGGAPKSLLMVIAAMKLMHDTRCLGLVHWDDPEGWYQEGGGKGGSG